MSNWTAHTGEDYTVVMRDHETTDSASVRVFGEDAAEVGKQIAAALTPGHTTNINQNYLEALQQRHELFWFTISGSGEFPWDMLRFDYAWPSTGEDAAKMFAGRDGKRSIRMGCASRRGPTAGRWENFGWRVLPEPKDEGEA